MEGVRPGNQNTQVHTLVLPLAPCVALAKSVHSQGISFLICRKAIITTQMPLGSIQGGNKGQGADFSCLLFCLLGTKITNWLFYTLLTCKKKQTKTKKKKKRDGVIQKYMELKEKILYLFTLPLPPDPPPPSRSNHCPRAGRISQTSESSANLLENKAGDGKPRARYTSVGARASLCKNSEKGRLF